MCRSYPNSACVVYTGVNLLCIGVNTNDRLEEILAKIDSAVCEGGSGTGTVISFEAGNLDPLFTTSVDDPTAAVSLTFSLSTHAQNLVFASPDGSTGIPTFRSLTLADLPSVPSPAWQDTLIVSSTLSQNNTILGGGFSLNFNMEGGSSSFDIQNVNTIGISSLNSLGLSCSYGTISLDVTGGGGLVFSGLTNSILQNRLIGQISGTGQIGYVTLGTGLGLLSGILNISDKVIGVLSTITGINAKNIALTNLYTVPASKTAIITGAIIRVIASSAITIVPTLGVGIATGEDDVFSSTSLTGLDDVTKVYKFTSAGTYAIGQSADIIKLGIDVGATATTMTIAVDLIGYLI